MSTWTFDDDDGLADPNGRTYRATAFSGSEWGFGNMDDEGFDDSEDAAQSRRASHRPPSPTLSADNSHSQQQHYAHPPSTARARPTASLLHDLLNPAPPHHLQPSTAATSQRRTESRTYDRPQEHTTRPRATYGYSISALLDSDDEPTPQSNGSDGEFVTLESSTSESEDSDMPATIRTRINGNRDRRRSSALVDLAAATRATSSQQSRRRKRSAEETGGESGRAPRRRRVSTERLIEEVDLANDEAPSAEEELLQQQQRDAIKQQQSEQDDEGPQKIGKRQCIICMENFTNCTATSCGHFYCHECLTQALMTGEKSSDRGVGTCPVCRKPLSRTNKKKMDVIPIQFMKQSQFKKNQGKRGITT